jgi:hypothetical protein
LSRSYTSSPTSAFVACSGTAVVLDVDDYRYEIQEQEVLVWYTGIYQLISRTECKLGISYPSVPDRFHSKTE